MTIPSPPGEINTVRYIMGKPLQHRPGSEHVYSNIGYLLLGLVIKKAIADEKGVNVTEVSDDDYLMFLHKNVTRSAGIEDSELILGRSLHADPREPYYDHPEMRPSVFDKDPGTVERVVAPYGSFDMEARTGQGRIVTNARSLVKFLDKFMPAPKDGGIGQPRRPPGPWKFNHTGKLPGTAALARARGDEINYAVIFNKDSAEDDGEDDKGYAAQMREQLDKLIDSGAIKWPGR